MMVDKLYVSDFITWCGTMGSVKATRLGWGCGEWPEVETVVLDGEPIVFDRQRCLGAYGDKLYIYYNERAGERTLRVFNA